MPERQGFHHSKNEYQGFRRVKNHREYPLKPARARIWSN
ncbi:hypothetical protein BURCENBC7_AP0458 [Burkholderia cenocepacia BC7]|nr:hypothetical protein BURCENK562V_C3663 [Burkholderia cenocepacia K56-2Valvano]ERI29069.1 hypothetical protein BURCENBC7_AP0458 [Burkholderia cenocepacia BC7]